MAMIRPEEDIAIIEAFKRGDIQLLNKFYLNHRQEFFKWVEKSYGLSQDEAADVYQDAFIVLYKNLAANEIEQHGSSLKTYVFGIGKNITLKRFSKQKKVIEAWEIAQEEWEVNEEEAAQLTERQQAAMNLYEKLAEPCKSIIKMFYYDKRSMQEIAQSLGYKSEDVAKNQKARCLKSARSALVAYLNGDV
jgi:RNA polymerase sigma-70 factor (ECF subfamily)